MNTQLDELRARLHAYRDFEDALLHDLRWEDYGLYIEADLEYVWRGDTKIRGEAEPKTIVTLRFGLVQTLEVNNRLNEAQLRQPEKMNWGMGIVALCEVEEIAGKGDEAPVPEFRMILWRESSWWIRIRFSTLEMSETTM